MVIGVPKEIKDSEFRVGLVPSGARALVEEGHSVLVERGAGVGSAISDEEYVKAGARIASSAEEVWSKAGIVIKVKEPIEPEYRFLREGLTVFTFFHLAAHPALAEELLRKGSTAVAYETVQLEDGTLPILSPMSEVAGRLAVQAGAHHLMKTCGGRGVLLSGVPGVECGMVAIAGAGTVGLNATKTAVGLGAEVLVLDTRAESLRRLDDIFGARVKTLISNAHNLDSALERCDLFIGAVHIPGARTPRLVKRNILKNMKKGSVIVDVSVDQGGCVETIRPTTHSEPVYEVDGVVHYGVANMPGAVPRTSTFVLTNATLPYLLLMAEKGVEAAARADHALGGGVNIHRGEVIQPHVAEALGKKSSPLARPD
ncbi:MAG: alanine dehydrogenase [Thermodesulfobacteriota bacterium]